MKLLLVGLFTSVSLAGCSSGDELQPPSLEFSTADNGKQETVRVGEEADLLLQTIGPGGYGDPVLSSNAVRFLDVALEAANPGGPLQRFRFTAVSAGTASLHIPHTEQQMAFDLVIVVNE